MTKRELAKIVAARTALTHTRAEEALQATFDVIVETLAAEGRVELRSFGIFEVRQRKARQTRNPKTGVLMTIPPHAVVNFKSGKGMREQIEGACLSPTTR
jgi:nucleoid DNA-binding protein